MTSSTNAPAALPEPVEANPKAIGIYQIVVIALALLGVLTVLGSVAVGALAGMVAPTSR